MTQLADPLNPLVIDTVRDAAPVGRTQAALLGVSAGEARLDPVAVAEARAQQAQSTGFLGMLRLSAAQESITGTGAENLGAFLGDGAIDTFLHGPRTEDRFDPDFNPFDLIDADFLQAHPFMVDAVESLDVLDIPNRQAFDRYVARRRRRHEDAQQLAQVPLGPKRITATLVGQVPDVLLGGYLVRGAGVVTNAAGYGQRARQTIQLFQGTTGRARLARIAAAGGANTFQELGLQWADPNRDVDLTDPAVATAAVFGLGFGASFEAIGAARQRIGSVTPVPGFRRSLQRLRESFAPETIHGPEDVARSDVATLEQLIAEPVTGPRTVAVVDSNVTRPLIERLQHKYDQAGVALHVQPHPGQEFLEWAHALDQLEAGLDELRPAAATEIAEGRVAGAAGSVIERYVRLLNSGPGPFAVPAQGLRNSISRAARLAHRVFFDEATPTAEQAARPLTEAPFIPAESLRVEVRTAVMQARQDLHAAIDKHLKSKAGPVTYHAADGEAITITNRRQVHRLGRAALDYIRQTGEARRGRVDARALDDATPEVVKDAAAPLRHYFADMLDRLDQVELLQGRRTLERMDDNIGDLDEAIGIAEANLRPPPGSTDPTLPQPGAGDVPTVPDAPVVAVNTSIPPQWRGEDLHLWRDGTLRTGGNRAIQPDQGRARKTFDARWLQELERIDVGAEPQVIRRLRQLTDEVWKVRQRRGQFWQATHYLAPPRLIEEARRTVDQVRHDQATAAIAKQKRRLAQLQEQANNLRAFVDAADSYVPRRWVAPLIRKQELRFKSLLVEQWRKNREVDFHTSESIQPSGRALDEPVIDRLPVDDRNLIDEFEISTEQGLIDAGGDLHARYLTELDAYLQEQAEATIRRMLDPQHGHGIEDAYAGGSPLMMRRLRELDESTFREFLDDSVEQVLLIYDNQLGGKIAARRAIQRNADRLTPFVRETLDEDLELDPGQVLRAVEEDFRNWRRAAEALGNEDLGRKIERSRQDTLRILTRKLDELQGIPAIPENVGLEVGWSHFLQRNFLKMPAMAFLGKVTASSFPDIANLSLYTRMERSHFRAIVTGLRQFAEGVALKPVSKDGLEGLSAALDDDGLARTMQLMEINDLPFSPHFGDSVTGRALQKADAVLDGLNRGFFRVNGMTRWNTVWKRVAARLVSWQMLHGAQLMARARRFMDAGESEGQALRHAGLSRDDAARLNRLGINGNNAAAVVEQFHRHGTDVDGQAFSGLSADDFAGYKRIVHPNLKDWNDPDLVEAVTAAINSEVDNLIVTPKLLSRPLFNTDPRFGFIGKVFHQFQAFAFAYGNQLAPQLAGRPGFAITNFLTQALFLGAISDAVHNAASGRRDLGETINLWTDPKTAPGMAYAAVNRAGVFGYLARPMAIADQAGVGVGPILGNDVSSMAAANAITVSGNLGPFVDWADALTTNTLGPMVMEGRSYDARTRHALRKTLPFQNLLWTEALYTATRDLGFDSPIGRGEGVDVFLTRPAYEAERE